MQIPAPTGRYRSRRAWCAAETAPGESRPPAHARCGRSSRRKHGRGPDRRTGKKQNFEARRSRGEKISWENWILPCLRVEVSLACLSCYRGLRGRVALNGLTPDLIAGREPLVRVSE